MATPHTPIVEPPRVFSECDVALQQYGVDRYNYCNMILEADTQIGRVVDALKSKMLWDKTLLIFSTDNGGISNTVPDNIIYGSFGSNAPLRGNKGTPFEGGTRGVAFLNGGYLQRYNIGGTVNDKLYHVVDWYDTIVYGVVGAGDGSAGEVKDSLNGWQSMVEDETASPRNEWIWSVNFDASPTAIRMNDWKLVMNPQPFLDGYWDVSDMTLAPGQNESETLYLFNISCDEIEAV
eukprot:CAMPEP_0202733182 /NCGR_PEP_ID=MMETSP1385-20130828/188036_1 /ASSEMBLY_ACC=CAM_ASM_000861 /TAXON_ID=933848 /ORGANISM="Elphidium margaritaceum" /LENGTH=234 /DNA_ID=CAMNT_0049399507 /DNA_START=13 /DNA_END=714 /DNA_ORIENTATION=+